MLLDYHEIDHSPLASQQEKWFREQQEIEIYGMTKAEFDSMDSDTYARYLAGYREFDL